MKLLPTTWTHIRRSPYQALAAIISMFLTLLLAGVFFITSAGSFYILRYFESKPQITVFFSDGVKESDILSLKATLEHTGKTAGVKYISQNDALALYRQQNRNDPLLLEMVTADILPASLEISATDPAYLNDLYPIIKGASGVEQIVYQKDVVDTLLTWTRAIRLAGGTLAGLLSLDSILIVTAVIGMKIAVRKREVEILTLVGASPWYIRAPFILEGGFYGVISAVVSGAILTGAVLWIRPLLLSFLGIVPVIHAVLSDPASALFLLPTAAFFGMLLAAGFLLGSIGSLVAVGRYLKF
ncbi:permease-like cell division protein FtsX [Patescibacteria group bacterium]|nr:permease-like cell division protein FtsX [Patescibacteria group bacterium]